MISRGLIVDLFAGGGGASMGIEMALNSVCPPVAAALVRAQFGIAQAVAV